MGEWLVQIVNYIGSKLWYNYAFWAAILFKDKEYYRIAELREEFLKDLSLTLLASVIVSLVVTTFFSIFYKNKYNTKAPKSILFKVALFVVFLNLFKWELILLSPLFFIIWCITYLSIQENKNIIDKVKKKIPYLYGIFLFYLLFYVLGKVSNFHILPQ